MTAPGGPLAPLSPASCRCRSWGGGGAPGSRVLLRCLPSRNGRNGQDGTGGIRCYAPWCPEQDVTAGLRPGGVPLLRCLRALSQHPRDAAGPGSGAKAQKCISSSLLHSTKPTPTCNLQKCQASLTRVTPRAVQPGGIPGILLVSLVFCWCRCLRARGRCWWPGGLEQGKAGASSAPAKPQREQREAAKAGRKRTR